MTLLIDTTNPEVVWFALLSGGELVADYSWPTNRDLSERLLPELMAFLKKQKLTLGDLKKLAVVNGPGHFSCLRTGVATANALAFALNLPVVAVPVSKRLDFNWIAEQKGVHSVLPHYDKQPNISKPKKLKLSRIK